MKRRMRAHVGSSGINLFQATMRNNILLLLLLLSFGLVSQESASAQHASDPNAIDLTSSLIRLDTNTLRTVELPINVGDLNGDGSDDLLLEQARSDSEPGVPFIHEAAIMSSHGAIALQKVAVAGMAGLSGNFDGTGGLDLATTQYINSGLQTRINWSQPGPNFFDTTQSTLIVDPSSDNAQPLLAKDYNHDGIDDLFLFSNSRAYFYPGALQWRAAASVMPSDSIAFGSTAYPYRIGQLLGKFDGSGVPSLCIATSGWAAGPGRTALFRVQCYPNKTSTGGSLWSTTPVDIFIDTIYNSDLFVYSASVLAYDITGDGIDDLLVCDSAHIYIFKGGPGFGTRTLRKSDADFVITSPALLEPLRFGGAQFATTIFGAGDLTNTGTPYLGVSGLDESGIVLMTVTWFYAGGAALDTYFDGWINWTNEGGTRLVRTAGPAKFDELAVLRTLGANTECDLLGPGSEKMPHAKFSSVRQSSSANEIQVRYLSNHRVELVHVGLTAESVVWLENLLGQKILVPIERTSHGSTLSLGGLPAGIYFAMVQEGGVEQMVKLLN